MLRYGTVGRWWEAVSKQVRPSNTTSSRTRPEVRGDSLLPVNYFDDDDRRQPVDGQHLDHNMTTTTRSSPLSQAGACALALSPLAAIIGYTLLAPYTKVEESFTLHALRDVLLYGFSREKVRNSVSLCERSGSGRKHLIPFGATTRSTIMYSFQAPYLGASSQQSC
jgi:hypothetical protein